MATMIPAADPAARPHLKALQSSLSPHLTRIRAHQAHLFGRIHPPSDLLPDERWDVDLAVPSFTITWGETVVSQSRALLLGTYSHKDNTFLWGDHNPSVAAVGTQGLRKLLASTPLLGRLPEFPRFEAEYRDVEHLCGHLTTELQWFGPYPGDTGDATAFLAVEPPAGPKWCTFCGKDQRRVNKLIAADPVAVCDGQECLGLMWEVAQETSPDAKGSGIPGLGCAFCLKDDVHTIMHRYTGMCVECIKLAANVVGWS